MRLSGAFSRKATALAAVLAFATLSGCVDPTMTAGSASNAALPKPGDNVYVASMDAGIQIPALPVDEIPETHRRQVVDYETDQPPGTIIDQPEDQSCFTMSSARTARSATASPLAVPGSNGRVRPSLPKRKNGRPGSHRRK